MEDAWSQTKKELQKATVDSQVRSCLLSLKPIPVNHAKEGHFVFELNDETLLQTALKHLKGPIQTRLSAIRSAPVSVEFRLAVADNRDNAWIRPQLNLDHFCEGRSNRIALMAARNILQHSGKVNPLYIYGETGTGKSHLLNAIASAYCDANPSGRYTLIRIDEFRIHFSEALQKRRNLSLKNRYRSGDMLFIEDLHSIVGASPNIVDELYFIFNTYYESGRQIVVSSDVPVKELAITSRWLSRFLSGLQVKMDLPDADLRKKILRQKLIDAGLNPGPDVIHKILSRLQGNARDIESAVSRLFFLSNSGIDLSDQEMVEQQLEEFLSPGLSGPINPDLILDTVCRICRVEPAELLGNSRKMEIALPRHLAMYLAVHYSDLNKSAVARYFKRTDHSTVIHAEKKIQMKLEREPSFQHLFQQVTDHLGINRG